MFIGVDVVRSTITIAIILAGFVSTPSEAHWAWKDANGRTVYSDRPPPPDIKAGSKVQCVFTGPVAESYPVQAKASEVLILEDPKK